jgi:hypothetical protein
MKIEKGNRSIRRKPDPAPLSPPQMPLDQTRARTRAAAVGSQRLTAGARALPTFRFWLQLQKPRAIVETEQLISTVSQNENEGELGRVLKV